MANDSGREIIFSGAPEKAGVNNLLEIYELFTGQTRAVIEDVAATVQTALDAGYLVAARPSVPFNKAALLRPA